MSLRHHVLACTSLVAGLSLAGMGVAAARYNDPVGDVKAGAGPICGSPLRGYRNDVAIEKRDPTGPDLASIAVSSTKAEIKFGVRFATAPPLRSNLDREWTDMLVICLDVPPLGPTPRPGRPWFGANFGAGVMGTANTGLLLKVSKDGKTAPVARFKVTTSGSTLTFSIPRRALADPASLAFQVAATRETDPFETTAVATVDTAPARGAFRYTLDD